MPSVSPVFDVRPVQVPGSPKAIDYGFDAAWVAVAANANGGVTGIVKIDGDSKRVALTIKGPERMAIGPDAIWVVSSQSVKGSTVRKIDPETGKTLSTVQLPVPFDVSVGAGAVWVTMEGGVGRVDPRAGRVKRIPVGEDENAAEYVLATDTAVWVSDSRTSQVNRIDPRTDKVVATIPVAAAKDMVAFSGSIWVGSDTGVVTRIDPRSNQATTIAGSGSVKAITACGGAIWAPHRDRGVDRIDPSTNKTELVLPFENDLHLGIACGRNELWITSSNDFAVYYHRLS